MCTECTRSTQMYVWYIVYRSIWWSVLGITIISCTCVCISYSLELNFRWVQISLHIKSQVSVVCLVLLLIRLRECHLRLLYIFAGVVLHRTDWDEGQWNLWPPGWGE